VIGGFTGNQFTRPGFDQFEAHQVTAINNHVHDVGKRDVNILGGHEIVVTGNWLEASKVGYFTDVSLEDNENILPNFTEHVSITGNLFGRPNAITVNEGQDKDLVIQDNWISGRWLGSAGLGAPLEQPPYGVVGGEQPDGLGTNLNDLFDGTDAREWFMGNGGTDELHGAGGMDRLDGGNGNDLLDGGPETDLLIGGAGNDRYIVDSPRESLLEPVSNGGIDTIESSVSWTLGDQFENLTLTGDGPLDGTGNAANNSLTGNAAANRLSAGAGTDLIMADAGDDWLAGGAGRDRLLGEAGSDRIDGGADNDQLDGGVGDDVLDGGPGSDLMDGDVGNDVYFVSGLGDLITEQPGSGQDAVFSAVSYVLPAEIETLRLSGGADIDGAGNGLGNTIIGNGGANTLAGGAGDDWMSGGNGGDTLIAGSGNDLVEGGDGDDLLDGGSGDDILVGDAGADVLSGGPGRDTFVLRLGDAAGDRIDDFESGGPDGDMLRLEGYETDASLVLDGSNWTILSLGGVVETFELLGVNQLAPADVLFV
jgi:Ca2+-binding RTX toxin-like protein